MASATTVLTSPSLVGRTRSGASAGCAHASTTGKARSADVEEAMAQQETGKIPSQAMKLKLATKSAYRLESSIKKELRILKRRLQRAQMREEVTDGGQHFSVTNANPVELLIVEAVDFAWTSQNLVDLAV